MALDVSKCGWGRGGVGDFMITSTDSDMDMDLYKRNISRISEGGGAKLVPSKQAPTVKEI